MGDESTVRDKAMSVAVASTSETMCVERITMRSPDSSESRLRKRTRSSGSSPAVGSSTMRSCGVVEQRLSDADSLLHSAGEAAQGATAHIGEVDEVQELVDAPARSRRVQAFDGGKILQEFLRVQVGINAEILGR